MKKISVYDAVGMTLCHDITKIVPGKEKIRAFKRGHIIRSEDIPLLQDLGKEHIYVWDEVENLVHEDEAALRLASAAAGEGVSFGSPNQGKVNLKAEYDGLLQIDAFRLANINTIEGIIMATLHDGQIVRKATLIAGTRIIPMAIDGDVLAEAEQICSMGAPLISVKPFHPLQVGIVTTGNEVYSGRIKDGFCTVIQEKILHYDAHILRQVIVPDSSETITREIVQLAEEGAELIFVTGGMSVDPDDVTPTAIRRTGAEVAFYGVPVLPGSMLMLAYLDHVAICGLPGCVMFNGVTSLDLILPYLFAKQKVTRSKVVGLGLGGLCQECGICHYPNCGFGK